MHIYYFIELPCSSNCYWKPNYDFMEGNIWFNANIFISIMNKEAKLPRRVLLDFGGKLQKN